MEFRKLGASGIDVPVLSMGTATFGGGSPMFRVWGDTDVAGATRLVDISLDAGLTLFDTADGYSAGLSEEILRQAVAGRRDRVLISTKTGMPMGDDTDDVGTSGERIVRACEASLTRLGTDYIDIYQLHAFDAMTPVEDMVDAMGRLISAGKIRCYGFSNFSGWHIMKLIAAADRAGIDRPVVNQAYYSLAGRDFEWEQMPLGLDQGIGTLVWSPLAGARLTGKISRNRRPPPDTRATSDVNGPAIPEERLFTIIDALEAVGAEAGLTVSQTALAWALSRPAVSSLIIGARNEEQLAHNLAVVGKSLTTDQIATLDRASATPLPYPYWHQRLTYADRNPPPI